MDDSLKRWVRLDGIFEGSRLSNVLYDCKVELRFGGLGVCAPNLISLLLTPDSGNDGMSACGKLTTTNKSGCANSPVSKEDVEDMRSDEAAATGEKNASHFV